VLQDAIAIVFALGMDGNEDPDALIATDKKEIDVLEIALEWISDDRLRERQFHLTFDINIENLIACMTSLAGSEM